MSTEQSCPHSHPTLTPQGKNVGMNIYKLMLTEPGNCTIFVTENNLEIFPSTTLITIVRTTNVEILQTIKTSEHQM